jgi:hypothetical protein
MRSSTKTLIAALHILAEDIDCSDGVANAAIYEAALRLQEINEDLSDVESEADSLIAENGKLLQYIKVLQQENEILITNNLELQKRNESLLARTSRNDRRTWL